MSMHVAVMGRAAKAGERRTSRRGQAYGRCRIAVPVNDAAASERGDPLWITVMAFGRSVDVVAALQRGAPVHAIGKLTRSYYEDQSCIRQEAWTLVADAVLALPPVVPPESPPDDDVLLLDAPGGPPTVSAPAFTDPDAD